MRLLILIIALMVSGCSTIRTVGDLELLNDIGMKNVGEAIRAVDKTMNVAGVYRTNTINTSSVNTGYGNAKQMSSRSSDIPTTVAEIQDLTRYIKE